MHGGRVVLPSANRPAHLLSDLGFLEIPPSTKLVAAMAVLLQWRQEAPKDKIISKLDGSVIRTWLTSE
jgi:hypothetical protein